jgi:hypothetical protein
MSIGDRPSVEDVLAGFDEHLALRHLRDAVDMLLNQRVLFLGPKHADGASHWIDNDVFAYVPGCRQGSCLIAENAIEELWR